MCPAILITNFNPKQNTDCTETYGTVNKSQVFRSSKQN